MIVSPEDLDQAMATVVDLGNSKDQLPSMWCYWTSDSSTLGLNRNIGLRPWRHGLHKHDA